MEPYGEFKSSVKRGEKLSLSLSLPFAARKV